MTSKGNQKFLQLLHFWSWEQIRNTKIVYQQNQNQKPTKKYTKNETRTKKMHRISFSMLNPAWKECRLVSYFEIIPNTSISVQKCLNGISFIFWLCFVFVYSCVFLLLLFKLPSLNICQSIKSLIWHCLKVLENTTKTDGVHEKPCIH